MTALSAVSTVRNLILDKLAKGKYPVGSKLPTSRELAAELSVNRNTVIKAYRILADLGLLTLHQGKGTFVVATPDQSIRPALSEQVEVDVADVVQRAWRLGVHEDKLRGIVTDRIDKVYGPGRRHGVFVECNVNDLDAAIGEIASLTGVQLAPLLLADLVADPRFSVRGYDAVFTSLFHVREVTDTLARSLADLEVIAIHTHPDEAALGKIARIRPGSHVGIVVSNADGGRRFDSQIATFTSVATRVIVWPTTEEARELAQVVDVIVCSRSQSLRLSALGLGRPIIELPFHVSSQSAERILGVLMKSRKSGSRMDGRVRRTGI